MKINRREFLRISLGSVTALCVLPLGGCGEDEASPAEGFGASGRPIAPGAADDRIPLLWVETGVCTGCSCALLGSSAPPAEILVPGLRLPFQETLMDGFGASAVDQLLSAARDQANSFILVVDGAVPRGAASGLTMVGEGSDGIERSAEQMVAELAAQAAAVIALGTCASFGGIPGSGAGAGSYVSVAEVIGRTPIRIPGCPPNPAWITSTLMAALRGDSLELDSLGRPLASFGKTVHEGCPRLERYAAGDFATAPGDPKRCLLKVGCKGPIAHGDCSSDLWQGRSCCIKANQPCIGCTTPGFLDARPTVDGADVGLEGSAAAPFAKALEVSK